MWYWGSEFSVIDLGLIFSLCAMLYALCYFLHNGCSDPHWGLDWSSHLLSQGDSFSFRRISPGVSEERFQRGPNHPRKRERDSTKHRPFFPREEFVRWIFRNGSTQGRIMGGHDRSPKKTKGWHCERINPDVAENLTIWTWVNWSERLRGEPPVQGALTSQTPAGVHFQ